LSDGASHLGPGHFFGEVALIEQTGRQGTVTWLTNGQLMRLERAWPRGGNDTNRGIPTCPAHASRFIRRYRFGEANGL